MLPLEKRFIRSDYLPFPDSAFWRVDYEYNNPFQFPCAANYYFQYTMGGDTVIQSHIYRKIYRSAVVADTLSCTDPTQIPVAPEVG